MKAIIDIVLLVIIALCTWNGYKKGLVGGVAGILAIIVSLLGGSLLSSAFAHEAVPALRPFVDGYIDSQKTRDAILTNMGYGDSELSLNDIIAQDGSLRYEYAYGCMTSIGFYDDRAEDLAEKSVEYSDQNATDITNAVVTVICDSIVYVGGLVLAFLLILILLVALANIGNLSFRLPNMEAIDEIGGSVLGFVKGFVYCVLLCWLLSFLGKVLGSNTLGGTTLGRFFLAFKFITNPLL